MSAEIWSALGAVASAIAALVALKIAADSKNAQITISDIASCVQFNTIIQDGFRRVRDAKDDASRLFEFQHLLNWIETFSGLSNRGVLPASTQSTVRDFLAETIFFISTNPEMSRIMEESRSSPKSFAEIKRFQSKNARLFDGLRSCETEASPAA